MVKRPSLRNVRHSTSRRWARRSAATAGLLACGLLAAACGSSGSSASSAKSTSTTTDGTSSSTAAPVASVDVSKVTLNIGDQAGTGSETLLTAAGLIDKLPFKAKWDDFTSGPPMLQAMSSGSVDVGGVGNAPPVFAAAGGAKIAIASAVKANPASGAVLVPKGSSITSVNQLKGKKIAVAQGSSANYQILAVLNKAGISVKDVDLDYLQPAAGLAALTSGSVAAWAVWSPYIEQAVGQDGARVLVDLKPYGQQYSFEVASRAALANPAKAAAIRDYVKLLNEAYEWSATHTQAWAKVWAKATGLPASIMLQAAKDDTEIPTPITSSVIAAEQDLVAAFYKAGLIPRSFDFSAYSYSGFNDLYSTSSS